MIISASRRTDIPAFYSQWFMNRIKAGHVLVPNPRNPKQVSQINLSPKVIDGIVFWTKNPEPMMKYLPALEDYMYYFQFTLTPYGKTIEPHLPDTDARIKTFKILAKLIGKERVIWRYDPILINATYTTDDHLDAFEKIAKSLKNATQKVIISFIDPHYKNVKTNLKQLNLKVLEEKEKLEFLQQLVTIASKQGLTVEYCSGDFDLQPFGISPSRCIDGALFENLLGCSLAQKKDAGQRGSCGCMESIDIGGYNTCIHGCLYCYANYNPSIVARNVQLHDPTSPMLTGALHPEAKIVARKMSSLKVNRLF